jgi:hypothetical protein
MSETHETTNADVYQAISRSVEDIASGRNEDSVHLVKLWSKHGASNAPYAGCRIWRLAEKRCIKCTLRLLPDMAAGRSTVHQMHPTAAAGYGSWPKHGASNAPYGYLAEARCIKCTLRLLPDMAAGRSTVHQMHPTPAYLVKERCIECTLRRPTW